MSKKNKTAISGGGPELKGTACSAFIYFRKNGTVEIKDALCFHSHDVCLYQDHDADWAGHVVTGLNMQSKVPKWWQVVKWYQLIQLIRKYASS